MSIKKETNRFGRALKIADGLFARFIRLQDQHENFVFDNYVCVGVESDAETGEWQVLTEKDEYSQDLLRKKAVLMKYAAEEFQAHHLAYQSLENNELIDVLEADGAIQSYQVHALLSTHAGLTAHALMPQDNTDVYAEIKIIFRGTKSLAAVERNLESSPGFESFKDNEISLLQQIHALSAEFCQANPEAQVAISVLGHSLGGADAQNMFASLLEAISQAKAGLPDDFVSTLPANALASFKHIDELGYSVGNSAGVPPQVDELSERLATHLVQQNIPLKLATSTLLVGGDGVQQMGLAHVLSNVSHEIAAVHLFKAQIGCEGTWLGTGKAHRKHFFDVRQLIPAEVVRYEYFDNSSVEGQKMIARNLQYKAPLPEFVEWARLKALHILKQYRTEHSSPSPVSAATATLPQYISQLAEEAGPEARLSPEQAQGRAWYQLW